MTVAIYAGSYDPFTFGHAAVANEASKIFGHVLISIGTNTSKNRLFSAVERLMMAESYFLEGKHSKISTVSFDGLLVDHCSKMAEHFGEPVVIVRGLRAVSDFENEMAIATANRDMEPGIPTIFIPTSPEVAFVSSTIVKEIAKSTIRIERLARYVKEDIAKMLMERVRER